MARMKSASFGTVIKPATKQVNDRDDHVSTDNGKNIVLCELRCRPGTEDQLRGLIQSVALQTGRTPEQVQKIISRSEKIRRQWINEGVILA